MHLIGTTILERPADDDYSDEDSDEDEDDLVDPEELKVPCLNAVRTVFCVSAGRGCGARPGAGCCPQPRPCTHTCVRACVRATCPCAGRLTKSCARASLCPSRLLGSEP